MTGEATGRGVSRASGRCGRGDRRRRPAGDRSGDGWLADPPAPPERLEAMGCKDLAAVMLDGDDAERRAALSVYVKKKCF